MSENDNMDVVENESEDSGEDDESMIEEEAEEAEEATTSSSEPKEVYLPSKPLEEDEELICDKSAYVMLHQAQTGAPCLSFDIVKDGLGDDRDTYPLSAYIVAGTQAQQVHANNLIIMKLSNLHKTCTDDSDEDDDDDDSDEEDDDDKKPKMAGAMIKHQGCVNRIRSTVINNSVIVASWSELGRVNVWNINPQLQAVDDTKLLAKYNKENVSNSTKPLFTFVGHQQEGFALDWCETMKGVLATGDCQKNIHIWTPTESAMWKVDQRPLVGHKQSVEDIQWSPKEQHVFASCSIDKSIRIWDVRAPPNQACMITTENAHDSDVNVINWNKNEPFIVSGGDDGFLKVWDLRRFQDKTPTPVAIFKHHTEAVTSVEWHPKDSAVFASAGSDNQIALWDLSVEKDDGTDTDEIEGIPPQLLFIHQGQTDVKELHWHSQLPGVIISTAASGFNIFRTISV